MAFTSTNNGHQSPASTLPPFNFKTVNTGTWGSGGNTCVITDEYIHPNSVLIAYPYGTTPQAGFWAITCDQGTATITSSDSESSTLTVLYIVL